ncbi:MAG: UDP-3-O-acyl-N-acetylglucosamine deacetylase [Campylobacterales bacterium]
MKQRTLEKPVQLIGIGLHRGKPVKLRIEPLAPNSGLLFYRADLGVTIPVKPEKVVETQLATVIGEGGATISTVEHLLSAISALGLDNLRIVVEGDEVPIMDGSSYPFVMLLLEGGIVEQSAPKKFWKVVEEVEVREGGKWARLAPSDSIQLDFTILFNHPLIGRQRKIFQFSTEGYIREIARARTFGFLREVEYLRSRGLALGGSLENAVVLDEEGILNDSLRYPDEFVRHKILDAIGDLALLGHNFIGSYTSVAGGHRLNNQLILKGIEQGALELVQLESPISQFTLTPALSFL